MSDRPVLSVIIPTYNRADTLRLCLRAFDRQETDAPLRDRRLRRRLDRPHRDGRQPRRRHGPDPRGAPAPGECRSERRPQTAPSRRRGASASRSSTTTRSRSPSLVEAHRLAHARRGGRETAILGRMTIDPALPFSPFSALHHDASYDALARPRRGRLGRVPDLQRQRRPALPGGGRAASTRSCSGTRTSSSASGWPGAACACSTRPSALGYHHHLLDEAAYLRIAEREGAALVLWYRKRPDLVADLGRLGLVGPPPLEARRRATGSPTSPCRRRSCPAGRWRRALTADQPRGRPQRVAAAVPAAQAPRHRPGARGMRWPRTVLGGALSTLILPVLAACGPADAQVQRNILVDPAGGAKPGYATVRAARRRALRRARSWLERARPRRQLRRRRGRRLPRDRGGTGDGGGRTRHAAAPVQLRGVRERRLRHGHGPDRPGRGEFRLHHPPGIEPRHGRGLDRVPLPAWGSGSATVLGRVIASAATRSPTTRPTAWPST
ncbi:hypothetical protein ACU4GA_15760 [Methylobacterium oryzae CBMB20]